MGPVLALALKDLRLLGRDPGGLFFTLGMPLVFALLFGFVLGEVTKPRSTLPVVVASERPTAATRAFVSRLRGMDDLEVLLASREAEALAHVRTGSRAAALLIRSDGRGALSVEIAHDPRRGMESAMLASVVARALEGDTVAVTEARRPTGVVRRRAVLVDVPGGGNAFAVSFPLGIVWGILGCAATFGIGFVAERERKTLLRLRMAPLSRWSLVLGKGLACFAAILAVECAMLALAALAFGVWPADPGKLLAAVVSIAVAFVGVMMGLAVAARSTRSANAIGWGVLTVLAVVGGGTVPLFVMPPWLRTASDASPFKWAVLALEGGIWRGLSWGEMAIPCGVLVTTGVVGTALGVLLMREE